MSCQKVSKHDANQLIFDDIVEFAKQHFVPVMSNDTRKILQDTAKASKAKKILEIGTAIGYSGIVMLLACPNATLYTVDFNEDSVNLAKQNFAKCGVLDRVNFFLGDAREIVSQLTGNYDFIFLDGPKGQYSSFLPYLLDLLNVGGTLVCDNVLYKGLVMDVPQKRHKHITIARNLNKFLTQLKATPNLKTEIFDIADGISVSTKIK